MGDAFDHDELAAVVKAATSYREVLRRLGRAPNGSGTAHARLRRAIARYGIDTSHFVRYRERYPRELLERVAAESANVTDVLRRLGVPYTGGTHSHISRKLKRLGIDTTHFHTPVRAGAGARRAAADILVLLPPGSRRPRPQMLRRALREIGRESRCAECYLDGWWRGRALVLEVDHIDGNWLNNQPGNLRLLCPNCHTQTSTYAGANKNRRPAGVS
jgi:hypothetical protein